MSINSKLSLLSNKKENKKKILSHLSPFSDTEKRDKIYEMAFQMQEDTLDLKNVFQGLKDGKLGLSHPDFSVIAKKWKKPICL